MIKEVIIVLFVFYIVSHCRFFGKRESAQIRNVFSGGIRFKTHTRGRFHAPKKERFNLFYYDNIESYVLSTKNTAGRIALLIAKRRAGVLLSLIKLNIGY